MNKTNWWKVAGIILLILNCLLLLNSVIQNEEKVKTHIGEIDREVYDTIQDLLRDDYEYVQIYNTRTQETFLMHGGTNATS